MAGKAVATNAFYVVRAALLWEMLLALMHLELIKKRYGIEDNDAGRESGSANRAFGVRSTERPMRYTRIVTRGEVEEILNRVLTWSDDDQEKIVRFVLELERWRADHDNIDETGEQADSRHRKR